MSACACAWLSGERAHASRGGQREAPQPRLSMLPLCDLPADCVPAACCRLQCSLVPAQRRHPKERALLAGSCLGAALPLAAYPCVAALWGAPGLRLALVCGAVNTLALWLGAFPLFASAGAGHPERYAHEDGGVYRGEWLGQLKQGYGVYTYPSGARYQGG